MGTKLSADDVFQPILTAVLVFLFRDYGSAVGGGRGLATGVGFLVIYVSCLVVGLALVGLIAIRRTRRQRADSSAGRSVCKCLCIWMRQKPVVALLLASICGGVVGFIVEVSEIKTFDSRGNLFIALGIVGAIAAVAVLLQLICSRGSEDGEQNRLRLGSK